MVRIYREGHQADHDCDQRNDDRKDLRSSSSTIGVAFGIVIVAAHVCLRSDFRYQYVSTHIILCQAQLAWQAEFRTFDWAKAVPDPEVAVRQIGGLLALCSPYGQPSEAIVT